MIISFVKLQASKHENLIRLAKSLNVKYQGLSHEDLVFDVMVEITKVPHKTEKQNNNLLIKFED
jgi:hypothetical protein